MGKNLRQPHIWQRADLQNIKRTHETRQQISNNPNKNEGKDINREFSNL